MSGIGTEPMGIAGSWASGLVQGMAQEAEASEVLEKAMVTGSGVVEGGQQGGGALREQYLNGVLETVSATQDDARFMKDVPKKRVPTNTVEWTDFLSYGGAGDDFVGETGVDGAFNGVTTDDNFQRNIQLVKYMAVQREVSLVTQKVKNISDPLKIAQTGGTIEIIGKANLACYFADAGKNALQFNGLEAQILQWLNQFPSDSAIYYDAGGAPLGKGAMADIAQILRLKFGAPGSIYESVQTYADTQKQLFPEARYMEGQVSGVFGNDRNKYATPYGIIDLKADIMLRSNRPLAFDGPGLTGKPRTTATADFNSLNFASNPFTTAPASTAAGVTGMNYYWQNYSQNTDATTIPAPPVPSGSAGGNASNHLAAGSYLYAVAPVYYGREGAAFVYGTDGTVPNATAVAVAAGQIVPVIVAAASLTGLGTTYARSTVKYRVYRAPANAVSLNDFDLLGEMGTPKAGNAVLYDNGMTIPGQDIAFMLTEKKNGSDAYFLAQLLPLLRRPLPNKLLSDLFGLIAFITPILKVPRHHVVIRNIGRYNGANGN